MTSVMDRRAFITMVGGILAAPFVADAQSPRTTPQIGWLATYSSSDPMAQRGEQAQEHLITPTTMYREMGMTYWLEQAEAELGQAT